MWSLRSLTRDLTHNHCIGRQSLNHWTAREVPDEMLFLSTIQRKLLWFCFSPQRLAVCLDCACVCVCVCMLSCSVVSKSLRSMDCSLPGSFVHIISHARLLKQAAISFSTESSLPRDQTCISYVSCIGRQILHHCASLPGAFSALRS